MAPVAQAYLDWLESILSRDDVKARLAPEALTRLEGETREASASRRPAAFGASTRLSHRKRDSIDAIL